MLPDPKARWLQGKTAFVTASSRNLGAEIARSLARAGACVAVNYFRSPEAAQKLARSLSEETGREHMVVRGDTSSGDGAHQLMAAALDRIGGRIDVLVNNSGPFSMEPFTQLAEPEWDRIWNANVKAAYVCTQMAAPAMRAAGWGRVVNISAGSAYIRNHSIYGLAKDALIYLTEELAVELGPEITVNALAPGQIQESAKDIAEFDASFVDRAVAQTPVKRLATRREVADMVALLCSPAFDVVTGATIPMDGGWRFHRF
jgi:NAD(P)-dependent dehydrogenase (short-subunit alcohol dehydrogenase family)